MGKCPACGGQIFIHWKCRVAAEYYCVSCGAVYPNYAGRRSVLAKPELQMVVDSVFREIGEDSVDLRAFFILVDKVSLKVLNNRVPTVKRADLISWGYEIQGSRIYRKRNK